MGYSQKCVTQTTIGTLQELEIFTNKNFLVLKSLPFSELLWEVTAAAPQHLNDHWPVVILHFGNLRSFYWLELI